MGWAMLIPIVVLLFAAAALQLWRSREFQRLRKRFDRSGDLRRELKSLPFNDRRRIARAARRGMRVENPREAELAVDSAERQLAVLDIVHRAPRLRLAIGLGVLILAIELHSALRTHRLRGRLMRAAQVNREQSPRT
jgi:hypothetical protein